MLALNVSPRTVMETLGHTQVGTTLNVYAHVRPETAPSGTISVRPVAQWTRAADFSSAGRMFESSRGRHTSRVLARSPGCCTR